MREQTLSFSGEALCLLLKCICSPLVIAVFVDSYRGYYCRRWEHDFYARKKYLQYVETKNDEVRRNLDDHNKKIR